jgi:hypothetical protein
VTGFIVIGDYNTETTLSGILSMIMAHVKPAGTNFAIIVILYATNVAKTAQIHTWWYQDTTCMDPAQRNSDRPGAYILVVKELSQRLFP